MTAAPAPDQQAVAWMRAHLPTLPRYFGAESTRLATIKDYREAHPRSMLRLDDLISAYEAATVPIVDSL